MNKNTILNKWPYVLGLVLGAVIIASIVMSIQTGNTVLQLAHSAASYTPTCTTTVENGYTITDKCDLQKRILKRTITNSTGDIVKIDKYNVVKGSSYLVGIEFYERTGSSNQKVQDEIYRVEEGIGSRLHSVVWNEVESGRTEYLHPVTETLWKKKIYKPGTTTLQWIIEYDEEGKFRSVRQFPQGTLSKASFFDENGDVFTAMDGKGNIVGKPLSMVPAKNLKDTGSAFFNSISTSMQNMNYDVGFMALGDSITFGWVGTQEAKVEWDSHFGTLKPLASGVPIDQTQNVLWRLNNGHLNNISPKVVMINIGTNNISLGDTPEETAFGIVGVIGKLKAKLPQSKIVLMGIFPRSDFKNERAVSTNAYMSIFSDPQLTYRDIKNNLTNSDGTLNTNLYADGLHLSAAGYKVWGDAVAEVINSLYNQN